MSSEYYFPFLPGEGADRNAQDSRENPNLTSVIGLFKSRGISPFFLFHSL